MLCDDILLFKNYTEIIFLIPHFKARNVVKSVIHLSFGKSYIGTSKINIIIQNSISEI